jgi:HD superfamily phosphohydrolase
MIDIERFLQTLTIFNNNLAVTRKGVGVLENMLMARGLMYSSVYFHKTVRIAELMLSKALEGFPGAEPFEFFRLTDAELMGLLQKSKPFQREIATRLKYRQLFKQAYALSPSDLDKLHRNMIHTLEKVQVRREKEHELEQALGIPPGHVIIDVPRPELLRAEPRIHKTDIGIVDNGELKLLDDFTPIAGAIRSRVTPDWVVMIITDEKYRDAVAQKAEQILFG